MCHRSSCSRGWLLDDGFGFHNYRLGDHARQVLIDVRVRIPVEGGTVGWIEAGTLDLTDYRSRAARMPGLIEDAARRLLRDGESLASLNSRYGWGTGETLHRIACWLSPHIERPYTRAAAVTASAADPEIPVGKVIYAQITGDSSAIKDLRKTQGTWIIDQILAAYLGPQASWAHGAGWVRRPLTMNRMSMLVTAQAGSLRRQALLSTVPDLNNDERIKDDLVDRRTSFWQPPLLFDDGWITPHICKRPSCPGGGSAPMTGLLPVPELIVAAASIYCEFCHCPRGRDEPLPAIYTLRWDVGTATSSLHRADGIPFLATAATVPQTAVSPLRSRDVVELTGLPMHVIQRLAASGELKSVVNAKGKRVYDPRYLEGREAKRVIELARQARGAPNAACTTGDQSVGDALGTAEALAYLGCVSLTMRFFVRTGAIENIGDCAAPAFLRSDLDRMLNDVRVAAGSDTANMSDVETLTCAAARFDVTTSVIKGALSEGVLVGVALGETKLVVTSSIDALDDRTTEALNPATRLVIADVAALAGISEATVYHHCVKGHLPFVQLRPRGRRFFILDEVQEWVRERESAAS